MNSIAGQHRKTAPPTGNWCATTVFTVSLGCALLVADDACACFVDPTTHPSYKYGTLLLSGRPQEPAVFYLTKGYVMVAPAEAVLRAMEGRHSGYFFNADTFRGYLRSLLPLQQNTSIHQLLAAISPAQPKPHESDHKHIANRRFWEHAHRELEYAFASMLEKGEVSVLDPSSNAVLRTIQRQTYNEVCFGGRRFMAPDGSVMLEVGDWIS